MNTLILAAALPFGMALGVLAGLFGTGGGTLAIPALVVVLGYEQHVAQGTALVMVVGNVVKALIGYKRHGGLDIKMAAALAISGTIGTALSAPLSLHLAGMFLKQLFGVFLVFLAVFVLLTHKRGSVERPVSWRWAIIPGAIGGLSLGMFGVGGAMLAVPILVLFFGQTQQRAQGLGLALAVPGCAIALAEYSAAQCVEWAPALAMSLGGLIGVSPGVKLAHRISSTALTKCFSAFLVVAGMLMILSP